MLLVCCMLFSLPAVTAFASEIPTISDSGTAIRLFSEEPVLEIGTITQEAPTLNEPAYRTNTEAAGGDLRNAMVNRQDTIQVGLRTTSASEEELEYWAYDILAWAIAHTGIGSEGDYLSWLSAVESISVDGYAEGSYAYLTYTYKVIYATTEAQENQVTQKVQTVLSQLDVSDADDYTKVATLYDYICSNVTYTGIPTEASPDADFMAYGALINGRANSYGFSHLFYRLALELGLDSRMIAGVIGSDEAVWNIVLVNMYYYNVDAALDAGKSEYSYFLKCDESFPDHLRYEEFATEDFYYYYPMDPSDYGGEEVAVDGGTCGEGVEWVIGHRGTLIITGSGPMQKYDSYSSIPWYNYREYIKIAIVEEGVTELNFSCFYQCRNLIAASLPATLTAIPNSLFADCLSLSTVLISEGPTSIGTNAFYNCQSLTELLLPSTLQSISDEAFYITGLRTITIPAAVHTIGKNCFLSSSSLTEILVEEGNQHFASVDGVLYDATVETLLYCPDGKQGDLIIPDSVISMAEYSCDHTRQLENVIIGNGLEVVPEGAFWYSGLTDVTFGKNVKEIHASAFDNCDNLKTIRFLGSAPVIEWYALSNVRNATAYYPAGDPTWTEEVMHQGGSGITWIAECANHTGVLQGAKEATCTRDGYTGDEVCVTCGEVFSTGSVIPATGHNYKDSICTVCGKGEVIRLSGIGRVETAIEVAEKLKETLGIQKFDAILLANGDNFADALAGSYLANVKGAPILLHRNSGTGDELNEAYIAKNLAAGGTVYLLGGTAAIPAAIEENLISLGYHVVRLSGETRFDTNLKILEEAGLGSKEILICTGWDYADSLSASATGLPILMMNTIAGKLTDSQSAFLEKYADHDFTIIGGVNAVSNDLQDSIEAIVGDVDRIYGDGREATSVAVAQRYFGTPDYALIAYSRNFPDGLCGGPLAYAMKAPLLLVNAKKEADAAAYIADNGIIHGLILGGTAAVSDASAALIFGE